MIAKLSTLGSIVLLYSGILLLNGCQHQAAVSNGVPIPAPHAAPPVQAQIQDIEANPHIPPAQKAALEARISNSAGIRSDKTPAKAP